MEISKDFLLTDFVTDTERSGNVPRERDNRFDELNPHPVSWVWL